MQAAVMCVSNSHVTCQTNWVAFFNSSHPLQLLRVGIVCL